MSATSILRRARDKVARKWAHGAGRGPDGAVCAIVAIQDAHVEECNLPKATVLGCGCNGCMSMSAGTAEEKQSYSDACGFMSTAIREQYGYGGVIPEWNDSPHRTQAEVVDCFDHAIKLSERDS